MKKYKSIISYAVILLLLGVLVWVFIFSGSKSTVKYSDILTYFRTGQVESFTIDNSVLALTLKENDSDKVAKKIEYRLYSVTLFLEDVTPYLSTTDAEGNTVYMEYDLVPPSGMPSFWDIMPLILIVLSIGILIFFIMGQMSGGGAGNRGMTFGKARLKLASEQKKKVTFADVAGAKEEKEELVEIVEFLRNPDRFTEMGAHIPRGVLLVGPPGTGKTYLAKATAGEAGVPFFSISGSDFVELYVGVGASRVRDTFEQAKRNAPCIIFIDEIDAVGRQRGAGLGGGNDEREQTLNQLLVEMDGFEQNEGVIVMAATNRPDVLDSALLRPGRFDRMIVVSLPDVGAREAVLKIHAKNKPLDENVDLRHVARSTAGFSPADLENILNEAALLAARKRERSITPTDIDDAVLKVYIGVEKKSNVMTEKDKRLTAFHEAGHAVVTAFLENHDPVREVSIIPRGAAGGYTYYVPTEDKAYMSRNEMLDNLVTCLGGRASEKLCLSDISTGASEDIKSATDIARKMVMNYGMSERIGTVSYGSSRDEVFLGRDFASAQTYSESTASMIDSEIKRFIDEAYAKAIKILTDNFDKLKSVAQALIDKEKISGDEFCDILGIPHSVQSPVENKVSVQPTPAPTEETSKPESEPEKE